MTDLPHYLYGSYELPHRGDGTLFHYTSVESFKKILEDMTLLPSSFEKLNDMNDGNVHNMCLNHNFMVMYEADKYIKERYHILCFAQNYELHGYPVEGTNHPAMWAHYADNSNGACIVIDKDAFIEKNKNILSAFFHKFEDDTFEIAFKIIEVVKANITNHLYANYEQWLKEEQGY